MVYQKSQYYHPYYHSIIYAALARLDVRGTQAFTLFFCGFCPLEFWLKVPCSNLTNNLSAEKNIYDKSVCFLKYADYS
jgi:hypothetical protein